MDCPSSKLKRDDRDHKRRSYRDDRHRHQDSSDQHNSHRSRRLSCEEEYGGSRDRESERERTYDDKREKERSSESQLTRDDRDHKRRSCRDDRHRHRVSSDQHNRHRSRRLSYEEECGGSRDLESERERTYDDKREKERSSKSQINYKMRGLVSSKLQIVVVQLFLMIIMSTHAHVPPPPPKLETHVVGDNYVAPVLGSLVKGDHTPKPQRARGLAGHDNVAHLVGSLEKGPVLPSAPNPVTYIPGSGSPHPPPTLPASTTSQRAFVGHNDAPVLGSPLKGHATKPQRTRGLAGHDNVAPLVGSLEKGPVLPSAPNPVTYIPGSGSPHPPPTLPASTTSQRAFVGHNDSPVLGSPLKGHAPKHQKTRGLAGHDNVAPLVGSLEKGPVLPSAPNPVTYIPGSGSPHPPPTLPASTTSQRAFVGHTDAPVLGSPLKGHVPPAPKSQRAGYDNAIDQKGLAGHAVAPILQAQSRP